MSSDPGSMESAANAFLERMNPPEQKEESAAPEETPMEEPAEEPIASGEPEVEAEPEAELESEDGGEAGVYEFDPAYVVRIPTDDGGTEDVTLGELRSRGLRQKDYTQKTQALAEERRQASEQSQAMHAAVEHLSNVRQELEAHTARFRPDPQRLADLRETDPGQYALLVMQERERNEQLEEARTLEARAQQAMQMQRIPEERRLLAESVPAFAGEKFDAEYAGLGQWAVTEGGMTPEVWNQLVDHPLIRMVWEARQYRKTASSAPRLRKKLEGLPKVVRPGTGNAAAGDARGRAERASMDRLAKEGSVDAAAAAILARRRDPRGR